MSKKKAPIRKRVISPTKKFETSQVDTEKLLEMAKREPRLFRMKKGNPNE